MKLYEVWFKRFVGKGSQRGSLAVLAYSPEEAEKRVRTRIPGPLTLKTSEVKGGLTLMSAASEGPWTPWPPRA